MRSAYRDEGSKWMAAVAVACLALGSVPALGNQVVSQASGNWAATATWTGGIVPGTTDDVFIAAAHTVTLTNLIQVTVNSLSVSGVLTHASNPTNRFRHRINLRTTGDLTIPAAGSIDVTGLGYTTTYGPGATTGGDRRCGASHGGKGTQGSGSTTYPGPTYDSIIAPTNLGSGGTYTGNRNGGGAILLTVGGEARVYGLIRANGTNDLGTANSGGSGGSVYLTASNVVGSGVIEANGGASSNDGANSCGAGGGGRVAVVLTGSSSFGSVVMQAFGGTNLTSAALAGAAGTVYKRTQTQGPNEGTLIVANRGLNPAYKTDISSNVTDAAVGDVIITDGGTLLLCTNQSLVVNGSFSNGYAFTAQTGSTLQFGGTNAAYVYGNLSHRTLICTNAGKTLFFQAGRTNTVEEGLTLKGDASSNLYLRSTVDGSNWCLSVNALAIQSLDYVDVKDSKANVGYATPVSAKHLVDSGHNTNWVLTVTGYTNVWLGTSNSTWSVTTNWSLGWAPLVTDAAVVIPGGKARYPVLDTTRELPALIMESGSWFSLNGNDVTLYGDAVLGGAFVATATETIGFRGNVDFTGGTFTQAQSTAVIGGTNGQSITSAGRTFYKLTVTNSVAPVTFADAMAASQYRSFSASVTYGGNLSAGSAWIYSDGGAITQTFASGCTYAMPDLYLLGAAGKTQYLRSSGAGAWLLNVSNVGYAKYVDVQNSDASGGLTIHPVLSGDSGGNSNWVFNADWKVWTGTASTSFTNDANWSPSGAPTAGSLVLIDDPDAVKLTTPATIYRLVLGGSTQATFEVNAPLTVQDDVQILAGGVLTHTTNAAVDAYKLNLSVATNLTVATNGQINVDGKGYASGYGWGTPAGGPLSSNKRSGASYGGRGAIGSDNAEPGTTYGSVIAPTNLGSGGSSQTVSPGGGAALLTVGGVTRVDGLISANGVNPDLNANGAGSGGSVYLTTSSLIGSGLIQANGARGWSDATKVNGSGGGGRVAVVLTGSSGVGSVTVQALGGVNGSASGSAGTVYTRNPSQGPTEGALLVANNGITGDRNTEISSSVTDATVGDVLIQSGAVLQLNTNQMLTVNGTFSNGNVFVSQPGSTLRFTGTGTATVYSSLSLANLVCSNASKTLRFQAGRTNTILEGLVLQGMDEANRLVLRSSVDTSPWYLSVTNSAYQHAQYVDVKDSHAEVGYATAVSATSSTNSGGNSNWVFTTAGSVDTWIGAVNTSWSEPGNWDQGRSPLPGDTEVVISNGCAFYPVLTLGQTLPLFTMQPGSALSLNGQNLTLTEDATIHGTVTASGTEAITFQGNVDLSGGSLVPAQSVAILSGGAAQSVVSAGARFHVLMVSNTAGLVTFVDTVAADDFRSLSASVTYGGGATATDFHVYSDGGSVAQTFAAGSISTIQNLYLLGVTGKVQVLRSTVPGTPWRLNVADVASVRYADVADSDASGGRTVHALQSTDSTGNTNWVFGTVWKTWTGAADTSFANGNNWSPTGAPSASDYVLIDSPNLAVLSTTSTVSRLVLGGSTTATLRANGVLTVLQDLQVLPGGTLTHGSNTTVETYKLNVSVVSNLTVTTGGVITATALGFNGDYGTGVGTDYGGGGSYGGQGGYGRDAGQAPGPTYGSITAPTNIGSGGAIYSGSSSGNGGGAIRLVVGGTARVDGTVSAGGKSTAAQWSGGGSGGSIWLTAGSLAGTGTIKANGGDASYGSSDVSGGGGGRIAVRLTSSDAFGGVVMQAYGGTGTRDCGAAGTVYLEGQSDTPQQGRLIVDNIGRATTLGEMTDLNGTTGVTLSPRSLLLRNAAILGVGTGDVVTVTNTVLAGDATSGVPALRLKGGQLIVPASFTYSNLLVAVDTAGSSFNPGTALSIGGLGALELNVPYGLTGTVTLASGAVMHHKKNTTVESYKIDLTLVGDLVIAAGAKIDVTGKGFQSSYGLGKPDGYRSGASYGGKGAQGMSSAGAPSNTFGSVLAPTSIGSGGGGNGGYGFDDGGGAVILRVTGATTLDGLIAANGTNEYQQGNSGGSGGSVYLTTASLSGSGTIQANGGPAWSIGGASGAGGGGRVAIILTGSESFGGVTLQACGGANGSYSGGAGTVYKQAASQTGSRGLVMVDNSGMTINGYAELPGKASPGYSNELSRATLMLTNTYTRLTLTTNAMVGNLRIYTNADLVLGGCILTVNVAEHPLNSLTGRGPGATNRVDHYAQIRWNPSVGTVYSLR